MRFLRAGAAAVDVRRFRIERLAVLGHDKLPGRILGVARNADRIRTHVRDQADRPLSEIQTLVQVLRQAHGALGRKPQEAGTRLLQRAGDEGRQRAALDGARAHVRDAQGAARKVVQHGLGSLLRVDFNLGAVDFGQLDREIVQRRDLLVHDRAHHPVGFRIERQDQAFALADQPQRHGLDASGAESAPHLAPQQRAHHVADDAVQHAPRLLRVHAVHVDLARVLERLAHGPRRDLVVLHAKDRLALAGRLERLAQMPRNRLPLAVRIGRQIDDIALLGGFAQLLDHLGLLRRDDVFGRKMVLDVDAQFAFRQVADVPHGGLHQVILAQHLANRLGLGRRFHNHEVLRHNVLLLQPWRTHPIRGFRVQGKLFTVYCSLFTASSPSRPAAASGGA